MGELRWSSRAANPSKKSKTAARIISRKASVKSPKRNAATTAQAPQSRFESVSRLGMVKSLIFMAREIFLAATGGKVTKYFYLCDT